VELWDQTSWRAAHLEGILNGLACYVVVGILPHFLLTVATQRLIGTFCVITAYSNTFSKIICAFYNVKGLVPAGTGPNVIAFALNILATISGLFTLIMLMGVALYAVSSHGHQSQHLLDETPQTLPSSQTPPPVASSVTPPPPATAATIQT